MSSSGWLDNNYQILMVTFSNWLTGDALLWFIEFLFEITSSDQLTHIAQLFTRHLISYPFLKVAHTTKEYSALRHDFTSESRDRKSFKNVKIKSFTIGQDRQHTLQRDAAVSPAQIQFQSALKQLHLNIKEPISNCNLPLANPGPVLSCHWTESSSSLSSGNIPNCLLGQFESWNGTQPSKSNFLFNWAECSKRCEMLSYCNHLRSLTCAPPRCNQTEQ